MKSFYLVSILFLAFSTSATARWFIVADDLSHRHYIDETTIKRDSNNIKAWFLKTKYDSTELSEEHSSSKFLTEFNCKDEKVRTLTRIDYSHANGNGDVVTSIREPSDWAYIVPNTIGQVAFNTACSKTKFNRAATKSIIKSSWKLLETSDTQDIYILENQKKSKLVWTLFENHEYLHNLRQSEHNYVSQVNLIEISCKSNNLRYIEYASFSGTMGTGNVEDWGSKEKQLVKMGDTNIFKKKFCD